MRSKITSGKYKFIAWLSNFSLPYKLQGYAIALKRQIEKLLPFLLTLYRKRRVKKANRCPPYRYVKVQDVNGQVENLPIYSGIGVGVYQGSPVILRKLEKDYFAQDWVVERLLSHNFGCITKRQALQLFQLACLILHLQQCDQEVNCSQIVDEIELATDCPYSTLPKKTVPESEVLCDTESCPVQKVLWKLPERYKLEYRKVKYPLLCPLSPLYEQVGN